MVKALVLVAGVCLLAVGGEGLSTLLANRRPSAISCEEYARLRPDVAWIRLSGCEVDYLGAGYREANGRVQELLFPARPGGQSRNAPAPLVAATRDPAALAIAERTIGGGRQPDQEQFLVMMLKILTLLRASRELEGFRRTGLFARVHTRRALSGLTAPLIPGVTVIDLHSRPDIRWPAIEIAVGTALVGMALLWFRRSRQKAEDGRDAPVEPPAAAGSESPLAPRQQRAPLHIRGLLLLNLKPTEGTEQIETAPPLGSRAVIIDAMQSALPGIAFDAAGRGEIAGDDHRVAIDLGPHDVVHAAVASAEGDAGIEMLRTLVQSCGWRAYAARAGVFIEPDALDLFALPDSLSSRGRP
jgi:hypothetical protein